MKVQLDPFFTDPQAALPGILDLWRVTVKMFRFPFAMAIIATVASAQPATPVLHDGTAVRLRLNRNLSSAEAQVGESVDFEVLDDVKVNDAIVLKKGAPAMGSVIEAVPKRRMGRAGKL